MRILITGAAGQLGCELRRVLQGEHELTSLSRDSLDVTDEQAVRQAIAAAAPDAVIHSAAYTKVDAAESDREAAFRVNAAGTRHVALAAEEAAAKLVYVSTDYVFDGRKGMPYDEYDSPHPINVYGASKLAGEEAAMRYCRRHFVIRTSWLYGAGGNNFIKAILRQARAQGRVRASFDEVGSPTYALDLALFIAHAIRTEKYGIYHAGNRGSCSRWEWAVAILAEAGLSKQLAEPVPAAYFGLAARRPAYSVLDDFNARVNELPRLREWTEALHAFMTNDLEQGGKMR